LTKNLFFFENKEYKYYNSRCINISKGSKKFGEKFNISRNNVRVYLPHVKWLNNHVNESEVIYSYVLSPIYAMIYGRLPFVSVEIGTMRDLPLNKTIMNKTLWLAYKHSNHVIITNPDNNKLADEHGITNYSFCPHPLDEDICKPLNELKNTLFRKELEDKYDSKLLFFAPARQNWKIKGNDKYLKAFSEFIKKGYIATLIIPGWGQEIDRSKKLCKSLNINEYVSWISPMSEKQLIKYYQVVDLVFDQFNLGVFGLITPKVMSCGTPILTSYDRSLHSWCFEKDPPVIACSTEKEIFKALEDMVSEDIRKEIGRKSREWILEYHSKKVINRKLIEAAYLAKDHFNRNKPI
jgi:glycosyltransferase involved in cell wall biosynthesis